MVELRGRVTGFTIALFIVVLVGMGGFYLLKSKGGGSPDLIDAFSWTITTLSTLGYYTPDTSLNTHIGALFTSTIVILGISVVFIGGPLLILPWLEKRVVRAVKPRPSPIPDKNHVVICGAGEIIDEVRDALRLHGVSYVVVDQRASIIKRLEKEKIPYISGDPTDDDILKKANVETAIALIAAMDDESNAFVCLSAKGLKKDLRIVSIAEKTENIKTLHVAGAARVVNPKTLAGTILGKRACHEHTLEAPGKFAMFGDLEVRQYAISSTSYLVNRSIAESFLHSRYGAIVIGLWKEGNLILNPLPSEVLDEGTTILVMGTKRQLDLLYSFSGGWK